MNINEHFTDKDVIMDCAISILQEANKNGFFGFAGFCGQAALLINECLFSNQETVIGSFNQSLEEHDHHVGHVACLINVDEHSYFIIDSDAKIKSIDDIESWGMLDISDSDYIQLFQSHLIPITQENFNTVVTMTLTQEFVEQYFNCEQINEQRTILQNAVNKIIPLFQKKYTQNDTFTHNTVDIKNK